MKITKHILAACILTGMAACDTDKEIAVFLSLIHISEPTRP